MNQQLPLSNSQLSSKKLWLSTDGGARGNPGPAGLGLVIKDDQGVILLEHGEYLGETTNNVAEYSALISALKFARTLEGTDVVIQMDSELIVKQMTGEYKIKQPHLQELASQVRKLLSQFNSYEFKHVLREFNKEADRLVNVAIDSAIK